MTGHPTNVAVAASGAGIANETEGCLSILLVLNLHELSNGIGYHQFAQVALLRTSRTWSQFTPPWKREDAIATMKSLSLLTFPQAPSPTLKKVPCTFAAECK